jgi:hypothetical protein
MSLKAIAYHEAGHAVAMWHGKLKFQTGSIEPREGSSGRVTHQALKGIRLDIDDTPLARIRSENFIIACLAGPTAQRRYNAHSFRHYHAGDDHDLALTHALRLCGNGASTAAYIEWLKIRAKDLVEVRWPSVERVAAGLLENGTLTRKEIVFLIYPPVS